MLRLLLLNIFFINSFLIANDIKSSITFAPQLLNDSKKAEEFISLFKYIEKISGIKTNFVLEKDYSKILKKLQKNEIDIALLGPLPYIKLKKMNSAYKPIITLKQKDGKTFYRCVLTKFQEDKINFNNQLKVALTQPLSTCGYFMTSKLLKSNYNIILENQKYYYSGSHSNAVLSVLQKKFDIAGVKEGVAKSFETLGMRTIAKSESLPGFSLVVNTKTLSNKQIKILQELILTIPKSTYSKWKGITSYGYTKTNENFYKNLEIDFSSIPKNGNI